MLTGISDIRAWLVNLEACKPITEEINMALSEVAGNAHNPFSAWLLGPR